MVIPVGCRVRTRPLLIRGGPDRELVRLRFQAMVSGAPMKDETIRIRQIKRDELPGLAVLHARAYPDSLMAVLGQRLILQYLTWLFERRKDRPTFIGAFEEDRLVGFLVGFSFESRENLQLGFLRGHRGMVFRSVILRPRLLCHAEFWEKSRAAVRGLRKQKKASRNEVGSAHASDVSTTESHSSFHVFSVAVGGDCRGRGIGGMLMESAEETARERNSRAMDASVSKSNAASLRLFASRGFRHTDVAGDAVFPKKTLM